jgi:class 3 adenylate cyclase
VSNVASRLCDEAKPGQILISARVLTKVEHAVKGEPVGEFELKGIRRPVIVRRKADQVRADNRTTSLIFKDLPCEKHLKSLQVWTRHCGPLR